MRVAGASWLRRRCWRTVCSAGRRPAAAPQYRIQPLTDLTGAPGLSLALRKLDTVGTLMQATAHPDDENNAMLALYARHLGMRVALVTATRGDGGQNEIGTELFDALGILRTEELLAAHRFDGAEQYFTRAVDFGYSFSHAGDAREVGAAGDPRRLRPAHPHAAARRHRHAGPRRHRRRPAPSGVRASSRPRRSAPPPIRRSSPSRSATACGRGRPRSSIAARADSAAGGGRGGPPEAGGRRAQGAGRGSAAAVTARGADRTATFRDARHQHLRAAARLHDRRSGRRRLRHAHVPGPRADGRPSRRDWARYRLFDTVVAQSRVSRRSHRSSTVSMSRSPASRASPASGRHRRS